jgi:hypothetical protein
VYDANSLLNIDAKIAPVHYLAFEHRIISKNGREGGCCADYYVGGGFAPFRIDA